MESKVHIPPQEREPAVDSIEFEPKQLIIEGFLKYAQFHSDKEVNRLADLDRDEFNALRDRYVDALFAPKTDSTEPNDSSDDLSEEVSDSIPAQPDTVNLDSSNDNSEPSDANTSLEPVHLPSGADQSDESIVDGVPATDDDGIDEEMIVPIAADSQRPDHYNSSEKLRLGRKFKNFAKKVGKIATGFIGVSLAVLTISEAMRTENVSATRSDAPVDTEVPENTVSSTELSTPETSVVTIDYSADTVPTESTTQQNVSEPTLKTVTSETSELAVSETSVVIDTSVEIVTTASIEPINTIAAAQEMAPLSLRQRIESGEGEISLDDYQGQWIGTLTLNKFCDVQRVGVSNFFDYNNPVNHQALSEAALNNVYRLASDEPLSDTQRSTMEDDIYQKGLSDLSAVPGVPMYQMLPAVAPAEGCVPEAANPRNDQWTYGSTEANNHPGVASEFQGAVEVVTFSALPGESGGPTKVTYIQGHRSSMSAPFNGLDQYAIGDTVTYKADDEDQAITYSLTTTAEIDEEIPLEDLIRYIGADGQEKLVLQVCIDEKPDLRMLYVFNVAEQ